MELLYYAGVFLAACFYFESGIPNVHVGAYVHSLRTAMIILFVRELIPILVFKLEAYNSSGVLLCCPRLEIAR